MSRSVFFISFISLFLLSSIYTAMRLYRMLPPSVIFRSLLTLLFVLGVAGLFIFFSVGERLPISVASFLYTFSTSWMIAFLYLFMAVLLIDVFRLANHLFYFLDKETLAGVFRGNAITSSVVFGLTAIILIFGNIQYHNKKRSHVEITSDKITQPLKIVGISDLHLGYTISSKEAEKWVQLINAENPDMVIMGGDIIDNHMRPILADSTDAILRKIQAPLGVYACAGNHDLMFAVRENASFYQQAGINLLRDASINMGEITVIGRDDASNPRRNSLENLIKEINDSTFIILLDHQPNQLEKARKNGIDLQFSGHTHRGQIFPISLLTDRIFELSYGYLQKGGSHFYISSGIGIWGGKFRVGTRSEYVVFNINTSKSRK